MNLSNPEGHFSCLKRLSKSYTSEKIASISWDLFIPELKSLHSLQL